MMVKNWYKLRKQVLFFWFPITISIFILSSNLSHFYIHSDNFQETDKDTDIVPSSGSPNATNSLPIFQLYQDAKYAWDKLQLRKDVYGPDKTGFFFTTDVVNNVNYSVVNNLGFLKVYYSMYKMTNDSTYLDLARELFLNILDYCSGQVDVSDTT